MAVWSRNLKHKILSLLWRTCVYLHSTWGHTHLAGWVPLQMFTGLVFIINFSFCEILKLLSLSATIKLYKSPLTHPWLNENQRGLMMSFIQLTFWVHNVRWNFFIVLERGRGVQGPKRACVWYVLVIFSDKFTAWGIQLGNWSSRLHLEGVKMVAESLIYVCKVVPDLKVSISQMFGVVTFTNSFPWLV